MHTPQVVLFGGNSKMIRHLESLLNRQAILKPYLLEEAEFFSLAEANPVFFLICPEGDKAQDIEVLCNLQTRFERIPKILLAQQIATQEIDDYLQAGCSRILLYPAHIERIIDLLPQHSKTKKSKSGSTKILPAEAKTSLASAIMNILNQAMSIGIVPKPIAKIIAMKSPIDIAQAAIQVRFLGDFQVFIKGQLLPELKSKKLKPLLAYLLYHFPKQLHKNKLADLFWGDIDTAANSLQVAICQLRKHIRETTGCEDFICHENERYFINPDYSFFSDANAFRELWQKAQMQELSYGLEAALPLYHQAVGCYVDDFLEDSGWQCDVWIANEREALSEKYLQVLERMGLYFFKERSYTVTISLCQRILEKDPYFEKAHRLLMISYARADQRSQAVMTYQKCAKLLLEKYKIKPSEETESAYREIMGEHTTGLSILNCA